MPSSEKIGVIGLGLMGGVLAERLRAAGFAVAGYDIVPEKREYLARAGGEAAGSAREVAEKCGRLLFSLLTTDQAEAVLEEILPVLQPGAVIIDTTTGSPERMAAIGERLEAQEAAYLDATLAGSSAEAQRGEALVLAGGQEAVFERCQDIFAAFARQCFYLGPYGSGARMKLVFNLVVGLHRAVLAEALAFAAAAGVSPEGALEVLKAGITYSRVMDIKGPKMLSGDFSPQARLSQHYKDVGLILDLADQSGAKVPLSRLHARLLESLIESGCGDLDNSAILKAFLL